MFSEPAKIIEAIPIYSGSQVADLGAGSGAYTLAVADRLNSESGGKVFAVELRQNMLDHINSEVKNRKLSVVETVWGDIETIGGTRLRDSSIDIVLITNTLFQTENKDLLAQETFRILKEDGYLFVVDWNESFGDMGPAEKDVVEKQRALDLFDKSGFALEKEIDAGDHHYGLLFKKPLSKKEENVQG